MINIHSSIVFKSAVLFALLALGIFFVVSPAAAAAEDGAAAATFETFIKDTLAAYRMPSGTVLYDVICHTVGETLPPVSRAAQHTAPPTAKVANSVAAAQLKNPLAFLAGSASAVIAKGMGRAQTPASAGIRYAAMAAYAAERAPAASCRYSGGRTDSSAAASRTIRRFIRRLSSRNSSMYIAGLYKRDSCLFILPTPPFGETPCAHYIPRVSPRGSLRGREKSRLLKRKSNSAEMIELCKTPKNKPSAVSRARTYCI